MSENQQSVLQQNLDRKSPGLFAGLPAGETAQFRKIQRLNVKRLQRRLKESGAMGAEHSIIHNIRMTEDDYAEWYRLGEPTDALKSFEDWLYSYFVSGDIKTIKEAQLLLHGDLVISHRTKLPVGGKLGRKSIEGIQAKNHPGRSLISRDAIEGVVDTTGQPQSERRHLLQHLTTRVILLRREREQAAKK
jgi:hypothetical protein